MIRSATLLLSAQRVPALVGPLIDRKRGRCMVPYCRRCVASAWLIDRQPPYLCCTKAEQRVSVRSAVDDCTHYRGVRPSMHLQRLPSGRFATTASGRGRYVPYSDAQWPLSVHHIASILQGARFELELLLNYAAARNDISNQLLQPDSQYYHDGQSLICSPVSFRIRHSLLPMSSLSHLCSGRPL